MIIYKIQNKINGKIYIGQTKHELTRRFAGHIKSRMVIGRALRKWGVESFEVSIIDYAENKPIANAKEKYWIKTYDCRLPNGYNLAPGGEGGDLSKFRKYGPSSDETREKISKKLKGRPSPMKGRDSVMKNKKMTEEQKASMRKPKSEVGRSNISKKAKELYAAGKGSFNIINGKGNKFGFQKGHVPWQTGLTKETDERLMKIALAGKSDETRKKLSQSRKALNLPSPMEGKHHTPEAIQKMKDKAKGRIPWNKGIKQKTYVNPLTNQLDRDGDLILHREVYH